MARAERVGVIVPAAGDGRRLAATQCKALVELSARPLLAWALAGVEANDRVDSVVVVAHPASIEAVAALVAAGGFAKVSAVVAGGPTRRAIDRLAGQLDEVSAQGVAPGVAVTDTVRRVAAGDRSGGIVHREGLRTLQTPQVFL